MMKPQKGESIVELALGFALAGAILFGLVALFGNSSNKETSGGLGEWIDSAIFNNETKALQAEATFKTNEHMEKHIESADIMKCLSKNGPYQVWRDRSDKTHFYALCQLETGDWGFAICTASGSAVTAFAPGDASRKSVFTYVEQRATRFLRGLPKDCK